MVDVIEHLHDPLIHLQQAYRLLKKGGLLVMITPNVASLGHRLFHHDWMHLDPPRHLHIYACRALAVLAELAGLRVEKLFTSVRLAAYAIGHSIRIRRRGMSDFGIAPPLLIYAFSTECGICGMGDARALALTRRRDHTGRKKIG